MDWEVIVGDCFDVLPRIGKAAHVITDPPYSEATHSKAWLSHTLTNHGEHAPRSEHAGIGFAHITDAQIAATLAWCAANVDRWSVVFCDLEGASTWRDAIATTPLDYVRTCVWDKVDSTPQFSGDRPASAAEAFVLAHAKGRKKWNGGGRRNVFTYAVNAERGGKPHPTTKPLALMLEIVRLFTDPGDLVVDPFAGSGSTGVACLRLGRKVILIEKDEAHAAVAVERMKAEESLSSFKAARGQQTPLFGKVS